MVSDRVRVDDPPRAAVLRMEGTNNEDEAFHALKRSGARPEFVHIKELERGITSLRDYHIVFIPGGFSAGDYVRAGAIMAFRLKHAALEDLIFLDEERRPIIGVCNGFQVLTEMKLLPTSYDMKGGIALTVNMSNRFESRTTFVRYSGRNPIFGDTFSTRKSWEVPVAHLEGRIVYSSTSLRDEVLGSGQVVFRYTDPLGNEAGYPWNPNGSEGNVAAISNEGGNIIGLMPHPERIYFGFEAEKSDVDRPTGKAFFDALVNYASRRM